MKPVPLHKATVPVDAETADDIKWTSNEHAFKTQDSSSVPVPVVLIKTSQRHHTLSILQLLLLASPTLQAIIEIIPSR